MNTRRNLGLHAQTLGTVLNRGAQADTRGATQALDRGGQGVACGSCLSQALDRGAEAVARGAVPSASQVLDRGAKAVARGALAVRRKYLFVVPRPVPRLLPEVTRHCRSRRRTLGRRADEQSK
jgi:hypothetical protein